jgi:hypothetical protein
MVSGHKKERKQAVRWVPGGEEEMAVVQRAVELLMLDTSNFWALVAKAQTEVLPADRQRVIPGRNQVSKEIIQKMCAVRDALLAPKEPQVIELAAEPLPPPPPPPIEEVLEKASVEQLMVQLVRKCAPQVAATLAAIPAILQLLANGKTVQPAIVSAPPASLGGGAGVQRPKNRKIVVCGFSDANEAEIRKRSEKFRVDLVFASPRPGEHKATLPPGYWFLMHERLKAYFWTRALRGAGKKVVPVSDVDDVVSELSKAHAQVCQEDSSGK